MEITTFRRETGEQKEFFTLLASDLHIDEPGFDRRAFTEGFDRIKSLNGDILINGDVMSAILPGDLKRWSPGRQKDIREAKVNQIVDDAVNLLVPYVNNILLIGMGNHESAVLKHNSTDMINMLVFRLNTHRKKDRPAIVEGGYQGFVRFVYGYNGGHGRKYDIFYNHGQGGSAEVTLGIIDLQRYASWVGTDLVWLGHKHRRVLVELDPIVSVSSKNKLSLRRRIGVITGCYSKIVQVTNIKKNGGYRIDFGEERQRKLQSQRGIILKHTLGKTVKTDLLF